MNKFCMFALKLVVMKRECLNCGEIIKGRSDKKFCDHLCRNAYNNNRKKELEKYIIQINSELRKNRRILKDFSPVGKTTIRSNYLKDSGFNFNLQTNTFTTKNNNTYKFCYDYGYLELEDEKVLIVNLQDYMKPI
jgi:predicted nucleic acid-binding Zn ribbon protein